VRDYHRGIEDVCKPAWRIAGAGLMIVGAATIALSVFGRREAPPLHPRPHGLARIEAIAARTKPGSTLDAECCRLWLGRALASSDTAIVVPERWRSMTPVVRLRIVADGMGKWEGE